MHDTGRLCISADANMPPAEEPRTGKDKDFGARGRKRRNVLFRKITMIADDNPV